MDKIKNYISSTYTRGKPQMSSNPVKSSTSLPKDKAPKKSTLPSKVLAANIKMMNNPSTERRRAKANSASPKAPIDKKIDIKTLAKVAREKSSTMNKPKNPTQYKEPFKQRSAFMIDNKLKFKQRPVSTSSSKNKATISTSSKEKVNKIRGKKSEIKKEVTKFISEVEKVSSKKKSNSDPKEKKNLRQNFVRANLKGHYVEKKRVRPINIRKYKLNKGRAFYKSQEKVNMSDSNYMGNGDKGVDIDNKQIIDENISEKVPVFSEGFIVDKKEDITPNKNVITTRLTTALKSSLRKCVPLDTELKFLSKEFRYLLSDKKEEIEKLNQIKEEELHKKLTYTPVKEEDKMDIVEDDVIKSENKNENNAIMSDEEISKLENDILIKVLEENFKHEAFLDGQLQTIKSILNNKRTLTMMPPGCGKSLCFQLSSLVMEGLCIVVSPLISSITNNLVSLPHFLPGASLTSFTNHRQRDEIFTAIKEKKIKILFITPERFAVENFSDIEEISLVCFEDAGCVCPFSHSFRSSYISCEATIKKLNPSSLLFLSNSIGKSMQEYIIKKFNIETVIAVPVKVSDKLTITISKDENKLQSLVKMLRNQKFKSMGLTVVFSNTIKSVNQITSFLNQNGLSASSYHSGKDELERSIVQSNFLKDKIKILVCTSSFASSLNKKDVKLIIIFEIPTSIEMMIQQLGKSCVNENKKEVHCHVFLNDDDYFNQRKNILGENVDKTKLLKFIDYLYMQVLPCQTTTRVKRTYNESIGTEVKTFTQSASKDKNVFNHLPANISLNFNSVYDITDIKKQTQLFFITSLLSNDDINSNDESTDENSNKTSMSLLGIGPCAISVRFYKTSPEELAKEENIIKVILEHSKEKQGAYSFNTVEVCDLLGTTHIDLITYLFKLQSKGEITYEAKEDGAFLAIKKIPASFKDIITYLNFINRKSISINLTKLNSVYILLRRFAAINIDAFTKTQAIKCLNTYQSINEYENEIKKNILEYFVYDEETADVAMAGNEIEKNVILPIYNIETQRESTAVVKEIEDFTVREVEHNLGVNSVDIINILFGISFKGKEMKAYYSSPLWGKYVNYNYDYLLNICEAAVTKAKRAVIEKGTPKKKMMKKN